MLCRLVDGKLLVTRLKFMSIRPTEPAHLFAERFADPIQPSKLICDQRLGRKQTHRKAAAPTCAATLVAAGEV